MNKKKALEVAIVHVRRVQTPFLPVIMVSHELEKSRSSATLYIKGKAIGNHGKS